MTTAAATTVSASVARLVAVVLVEVAGHSRLDHRHRSTPTPRPTPMRLQLKIRVRIARRRIQARRAEREKAKVMTGAGARVQKWGCGRRLRATLVLISIMCME